MVLVDGFTAIPFGLTTGMVDVIVFVAPLITETVLRFELGK